MRKIIAITTFMLVLACAGMSAAFGEAPKPEYASGDVIVIFRAPSRASRVTASSVQSGVYASYASNIAASVGGAVSRTYSSLSQATGGIFTLVHSDKVPAEVMLAKLKARPDVAAASLSYKKKLYADVTPNDTFYNNDSLWGIKAINAPAAWENTTGSDDVYVVVIDSGVSYDHTDIKANFETKGYSKSFAKNTSENEYDDDNGHGTHVAGTIGAVGNNGEGVVGVNWKTKIISLRIFDSSGNANGSETIEAVDYLLKLLNDNPDMNIIAVNMSYGSGLTNIAPDKMLEDPDYLAMKALNDTGRILMCVAAGNNGYEIGGGLYVYPAQFPDLDNMIVVANASSDKGYPANRYSNYSSKDVDIAAPGSDIWSTAPAGSTIVKELETEDPSAIKIENGNTYMSISGTSMAAPHVAGAAALLKAAYPYAYASEIKQAILEGANTDYATDYTIHGFLDLQGAMKVLDELCKVGMKPSIESITLSDGDLSEEYSAALKATGERPITWSVEGGKLPEGITLSSSGQLSGQPKEYGTFNFTAKASNNAGSSTINLKLVIGDGGPNIQSTMKDGSIHAIYDEYISVRGFTPITWSLAGGSLPPDLKLDSSGRIYGAPAKAGTWTFTLKAENSVRSATKNVTLKIAGIEPKVVTFKYLPSAIKGRAYTTQLEAIGSGSMKWSVGSSLPEGLTLDSSTGIISGTPTGSAGEYSFNITAKSTWGEDTKSYYMFVDEASDSDISILTGTLPPVLDEVPYIARLEASGDNVSWSLEEGDLPDGISLGSDGMLKGIRENYLAYEPTVFKAKASSSSGSVSKHFVFDNYSSIFAMEILLEKMPDGVVGEDYFRTLDATQYPPFVCDVVDGELPPGLALCYNNDSYTYIISLQGEPLKAGTYTFTIRLGCDDVERTGYYDKKQFVMTIHDEPVKPEIITTAMPDGTTGWIFYSGHIYTSGTLAEINSYGDLPSGVNPNDYYYTQYGWLYGYPVDAKAGEYDFTAVATNSAGTDSKNLTITMRSPSRATKPAITVTTLAEAEQDTPYFAALNVTGSPAIVCSISEGALPEGLTLSRRGYISGITSESGDFEFTVRADSYYGTASQDFTLSVLSPQVEITIESGDIETEIDEGSSYEALLRVSSSLNTSWKFANLPDWIKTSEYGSKNEYLKLSGTSAPQGDYEFTVTGYNAANNSADVDFKITVTAPPVILDDELPDGVTGRAYSVTFSATGTEPISWDISSGTLPAGLSLDAETGTLSGVPEVAGSYSFNVVAENRIGTGISHFTLDILDPPVITTTSLPDGTVNTGYGASLEATGTTPLTWRVSSGALPNGLTLEASTGHITGTPEMAGTFTFTASATNSAGSSSKQLAITIAAPASTGGQNSNQNGSENGNESKSEGYTDYDEQSTSSIRAKFGESYSNTPVIDLFSDSSAIITYSQTLESVRSQTSKNVAAVLPDILVAVDGIYLMNVAMTPALPAGSYIEWNPDGVSSSGSLYSAANDECYFLDDDNNEIAQPTVQEYDHVTAAAYLEANRLYTPVITYSSSNGNGGTSSGEGTQTGNQTGNQSGSDSTQSETGKTSSGTGSSSGSNGGCNTGLMAIAILGLVVMFHKH